MDKEKKILFFLHLNNITMKKDAIPAYINSLTKKVKYPSLLCKIRNKIYQTVYIMYLIDFPFQEQNKDSFFYLQINKNMKYPFEININNDDLKNENPYYFYFDKILFKEKIKNNFFDNLFSKNKDLEPPFSCDINILEQAQLISGYISSQKRKEQFEILQSLKDQIGFGKFSRLSELFLMYLKIIFVDNYNTKLIQELLTNYKKINFDIKPSFNFSLFFDSVLKPIFLKPYVDRNFFVYNNFEYDLRNCLTSEYNKIFDRLCLKYYIYYDKDFLFKENNLKSRITNIEGKKQIYELLFEIMSELNTIEYCDYLINNKFLSKEFIQDLFNAKKKEINNIKNKVNIEINVNDFIGLKIYELDNYKIPFYCLGRIYNNYWLRSIDDKELYIYDEALNTKVIFDYKYSKNTTSLFQMKDGNFIIVYSNNSKVSIIEIKNIYQKINIIYSFQNINSDIYEDTDFEEYILKAIESHNKSIIILSKQSISFYYNKTSINTKEIDNLPLYDYYKYYEIKQKDNNIMNFSLLEFNFNFIIVISGKFNNFILNKCLMTFVNIIYDDNKNKYDIEYSNHKASCIELYSSVFEDNNILFKLSDDILGICGKDIYLYTLKYKEVFQTVQIPTTDYLNMNFQWKVASSFFITKNQIIYVAVKYFNDLSDSKNFVIKFYIFCILEQNELSYIKEMIFLSEAIPNSQQSFFSAVEIEN